jgi:GPN-loop GTPase
MFCVLLDMLYGCSMLYKTRLPLLLAFNKIDIVRHEFAIEWMNDSDAFEEAAKQKERYASNLTQSMGTMLEAFYKHLRVVGVSAITGTGVDDFLLELRRGAVQWELEYLPELTKLREEKQRREQERQERDIRRMKEDAARDAGVKVDLGGVCASLDNPEKR